ncbi:glycosyl transferase [Fragilaria crotonensis]|nr:glycosyl transferase [Fragilaria crotonensis]
MALNVAFSSTGVLLLLLFVILVSGVVYVFYPALSIAKSPSQATEKVVSHKSKNANSDILLSIVIPAYNEEDRLPIMLDAALASIRKHRTRIVKQIQDRSNSPSSTTAIEWIVVSDGSTDGTSQVVEKYGQAASQKQQQENSKTTNDDVWKLLTLNTNSGKGAAVKAGMLAARGKMQLMVDADGATDFDALLTLLEVGGSSDVVFGSRAHLANNNNAQQKRTLLRTILMHSFHICVRFLVGSNIQDTQCGFKLFHKKAAHDLFHNLHLQRWAFDIELVVLASRLKITIAEVGVPWHEVEGSKLDSSKLQLAIVAVGMLRDMLCVRLCYMLGIWSIHEATANKKEQ